MYSNSYENSRSFSIFRIRELEKKNKKKCADTRNETTKGKTKINEEKMEMIERNKTTNKLKRENTKTTRTFLILISVTSLAYNKYGA